MRKLLSFVVLCLFSSAMSLAQVSNDNEDGVYKVNKYASRWKEGEVIIKFKDDSGVQTTTSVKGRRTISTKRKVSTVLNNLGLEEMEQLMPLTGNKVSSVKRRIKSGRMVQDTDLSKLVVAKFDKSKASVSEAIEQLKALDEVEFVEPNYIVSICSADDGNTNYDDPLLSDQWGLDAINIQSLWAMPKKEIRRPVIAILDTGVDITHPDLAANIWTNPLEADGEEYADDDNNGFYDDVHGWDFVNNTAIIKNGMDGNGHGTHCAGIAAAVGNNGIGVVGANPEAYILPLKVMWDDGTGNMLTIIKAIDYAISCGTDVLSMSIGAPYSLALEQALLKAYEKNIICVGAAGNSSTNINVYRQDQIIVSPTFPAAFDFVVGVQATNENGILASFSNFDPDGPFFSTYPARNNNNSDYWNYEVKAPGTNIMSTYPGGKYKELNGTSMACPLVAGAISRILQVRGYDYARDYDIYGDIAESNNSLGVFDAQKVTTWSEDNRNVAVRLLSVRVDDSEFGDGDGELDAGEIVDLYPTVRSVWGHAEGIKVNCSLDKKEKHEDYVEFISNDVDFGRNISAQCYAESTNPIRLKINKDIDDSYELMLNLTISFNGNSLDYAANETELSYKIRNGVEIGGMITKDLTLYPNVNYIVTKNIAVPAGVTLTIKPGTHIYFDNSSLSLKREYKDEYEPVWDEEGNILGWDRHFQIDKEKSARLVMRGTPDSLIVIRGDNFSLKFGHDKCFSRLLKNNFYNDYYDESLNTDIIEYVDISDTENYTYDPIVDGGYFKNCIFRNIYSYGFHNSVFEKTNIHECYGGGTESCYIRNSNFMNNYHWNSACAFHFDFANSENSNLFVTTTNYWSNGNVLLYAEDSEPVIHDSKYPSYYGSANESTVRKYVVDFYTNNGFGYFDLSNMLKRPVSEAHGMVWKVLVNGKDAQDEFGELLPIGVGDHKIDVYFNRPMDVSVNPCIQLNKVTSSVGIEIPLDGMWSADSLVYSTILPINGKMKNDGLNTFYINGAYDNEHFEIPVENTRFKVYVQAAGSLSTGLIATPGLGKITLDWQTKDTNFEDLLGFNIYRSEYKERVVTYRDPVDRKYKDSIQVYIDTIIINPILIEPGLIDGEGMMTQTYTDYDVIPGKTYYYYVCEMSTDLKSYEASATVSVIPLTASKGDANGSMSVDIADVVTEVAYLTDQNPQPFIFDAADVNEDETINILDVVGTVNIIASPSVTNQSIDNTVTYTIEDGILYVESTTPLGGIQVSVKANINEHTWFTALEGLDGMEHAGTWLNDNEYMLLAYSMSGKTIPTGKQPILQIGDKDVKNIIVSDPRGHNLVAINGTATSIEELPYGIDECKNAEVRYFDITGRAVSASAAKTKGVYIVSMYVNGKCVKSYKLLNK